MNLYQDSEAIYQGADSLTWGMCLVLDIQPLPQPTPYQSSNPHRFQGNHANWNIFFSINHLFD